jgi:hypothetical protein
MMLSLATRSYLANKREADYGVCVYIYSNVKYIYIYRSTTDLESREHPQVTRSKPHAYTYNYYFNLQHPID